MTIEKIINEEWHKVIKSYMTGKSYNIYKNPTSKDFLELKKNDTYFYRYIVKLYGNDNVIYVFDGDLLHYIAAEALGIDYHNYISGDYGFGVCTSLSKGNKLKLSNFIIKKIKKDNKSYNIEFLQKYFDNI